MGLGNSGGRGRGRDGRDRDGRGEQPRGDRDKPPAQASREQKTYRAQLDRLFESGKIGELVADAEKARKFVSGVSSPTAGPPQVTVANGVVPRQVAGGSAADDRQRESRAGLAQELARAIQKADARPALDPVVVAAGPPPPELPTGSLPPVRRGAVVARGDGEDAETRLKLLAKLREAQGRDAVTRAVEALVARFAIPDDWEILTKLLEHRDPVRVAHALDRLEVMLKKDQPRRARTLSAQLRLLEETGDDRELCARAACIRALVR